MTFIDEIRDELHRYEADDHDVLGICMNIGQLIQLCQDNPFMFPEAGARSEIILFGHKITVINDIPMGEFVLSSRSRKATYLGWSSSGLFTTTTNGTVTVTGSYVSNGGGQWQIVNGTTTGTGTGHAIYFAPATTPAAKKSRGKVKATNGPKVKGTSNAQAGLEREKQNWKHQNKRGSK